MCDKDTENFLDFGRLMGSGIVKECIPIVLRIVAKMVCIILWAR